MSELLVDFLFYIVFAWVCLLASITILSAAKTVNDLKQHTERSAQRDVAVSNKSNAQTAEQIYLEILAARCERAERSQGNTTEFKQAIQMLK